MATSSARTLFSPTADTKCVLLFDWWLIRVDCDASGRKLAVSGFTTQGKQATRIFTSTDIVKRFDAYTLETADGIIIRIQGIINKSLMHRNGFPPEVSNCFLTGFPYSWESYAEDPFTNASISGMTRSTSDNVEPHKDSCSNTGSGFPVQTDDLPIRRILDMLNSIHNNSIDMETFSRSYKKKFSQSPMPLMPSNIGNHGPSVGKACFPEESLSKDTTEINQKHEQSKVTVPLVAHDFENATITHTEGVGCHENALSHEGTLGKVIEKYALPVLIHTSSQNSAAHAELEAARLLDEETSHLQSVASECHNAEHMTKCTEENLNGETTKIVAGSASGDTSNQLCLMDLKLSISKRVEELEHLKSCNMHGMGQFRARDLGVSKGSNRNDYDMTEVKLGTKLKLSADPDVTKLGHSPKASRRKQKCHTNVSRSTSKCDTAPIASQLVPTEDANVTITEGGARDHNILKVSKPGLSSFSERSSPNDIDNACHYILAKIESCHITAHKDKDPITQMAFEGGMESFGTLEGGVCSEEPPTTAKESENIRKKDQGRTCTNDDLIPQNSTLMQYDSLSNGKSSYKDKLRGSRFSPVTEKQQSVENDSVRNDWADESATVARKLKFSRNKGQNSGSSSMALRSQTSDEKISFQSKEVRKSLEDSPTDSKLGTYVRSKMKKSKKDDQSIKSSIASKVKSRARLGSDTDIKARDKSRSKYFQERLNIGAEGGDGDANHRTTMDFTDENKPTKCSIKYARNQRGQSNILEAHPITETGLGMIRNVQQKEESQVDASIKMQPKREKAMHSTGRKTIWRPSYPYVHQTMHTRQKAEKLSFDSPNSLDLKRSRSGRLLVPALNNGSHIIYDVDGTITGIARSGLPFTGSKSEPPRKKKKHP